MASLEDIVEPEPVAVQKVQVLPVREEKAIPHAGVMTFECAADVALKTVASILGSTHFRIVITWEDCPEEGVAEGGRC